MNKQDFLTQTLHHLKAHQPVPNDVFNQLKNIKYDALNSSNQALIKKRLISLTTLLKECDEKYYFGHDTLLTDQQYDALLAEINQWFALYPTLKALVPINSTNTILGGNQVAGLSTKIVHVPPMKSLKNIFNWPDAYHWFKKQGLDDNAVFILEPKFDGISLSLVYEYHQEQELHVLTHAYTRGDGLHGMDVINHIRALNNPQIIPLTIDIKDKLLSKFIIDWIKKYQINPKNPLNFRGELVLDYPTFTKLKEAYPNQYTSTPRNALCGILNQKCVLNKDGQLTSLLEKFQPHFMCYYYTLYNTFIEDKYEDMLFNIAFNYHFQNFSNNKTFKIQALLNPNFLPFTFTINSNIAKYWDSNFIPMDGYVIKLNDLALWDKLSGNDKYPFHSLAYKFKDKVYSTTITKIARTVGKTGKITYLAHIKPITIDGTTIKKINVFNLKWMEKHNVDKNQDVLVVKRAGVIPQITRGLKPIIINQDKYKYKLCPSCFQPLHHNYKTHVDTCLNDRCPGKFMAQLDNFFQILKIKGIRAKNFIAKVNQALVLYQQQPNWKDAFVWGDLKILDTNNYRPTLIEYLYISFNLLHKVISIDQKFYQDNLSFFTALSNGFNNKTWFDYFLALSLPKLTPKKVQVLNQKASLYQMYLHSALNIGLNNHQFGGYSFKIEQINQLINEAKCPLSFPTIKQWGKINARYGQNWLLILVAQLLPSFVKKI